MRGSRLIQITPKLKPKNRFAPVFSFDLRSLALFRIGLGVMIIADLCQRAAYFQMHYTDQGVLPRSLLLRRMSSIWHISIHNMSGMLWFQALLFLLAAYFAVMLIIGYRPPLMSFFCWFLLLSLQIRNSYISSGADTLFRMLMFWSMLLPMGAKFSVDEALDADYTKPKPNSILTVGTVCFLIQILIIYLFTSALKTGSEWRTDGSAVYYAMSIDQMTSVFADTLLQVPIVMTVLTFSTWWFELLGSFLFLIPFCFGPIRTFTVFAFMTMHFNFGLLLRIGIFARCNLVGFFPLLPTWFWEWLKSKIKTPRDPHFTLHYDAKRDLCLKRARLLAVFSALPKSNFSDAKPEEAINANMMSQNSWCLKTGCGDLLYKEDVFYYVCKQSPTLFLLGWLFRLPIFLHLLIYQARHKDILNKRKCLFLGDALFRPNSIRESSLARVLAITCILYIGVQNFESLRDIDFKLHPDIKRFGITLRLNQAWKMFARYPSKNAGWHIVKGELRNGDYVDFFRNGAPLTYDKPTKAAYSKLYPYFRIRKQMFNLNRKKNKAFRRAYARYVCREWNTTHVTLENMERVTVYFMREKTRFIPELETIKRRKSLEYNCFPQKLAPKK
ncbi:MAG: hypothetical protein ACI9CF_001803 [Candidatus Omnitrophota bacterium]|jgi:hypothetical protein